MKYIIGAYATAPSINSNELVENSYYESLIESVGNIRGLEFLFMMMIFIDLDVIFFLSILILAGIM